MYDNKYTELCQDLPLTAIELSDKNVRGRERPWRRYKLCNEYLSLAYKEIDSSKADRLQACGKILTFEVDENGNKRLINADCCRVRLCPLCSWRRSIKSYSNTMRIVDFLNEHVGNISYIFVTLTMRNCKAEKLSESLDLLFDSLKRLVERKAVRKAFRGSVRNVEVTHNVDINSESYDTFHPHIHMLVAVNKSYFNSRDYISQAKLTQLWKESLRVDYTPIVDVRRCSGNDSKAVAECSKYAAKAGDYIILDDWDLTVSTVRTLDKALANRRLINYSGIMRKAKQLLCLDDAEDGDLVHIGDEGNLSDNIHREYYFWYSGYRQYYKVDF